MEPLSRTEAQRLVQPFGWRFVLGSFDIRYPVASLIEASDLASRAANAVGTEVGSHLQMLLRSDSVHLSVTSPKMNWVTKVEVDLVEAIAAALEGPRWAPAPPTTRGASRPVARHEWCIDAVDIPAVRAFWKAVLGYVDSPVEGDLQLVDPNGMHPPIWFQTMEVPRTERNRLHLDVSVPHDEAESRIAAGLAAGGVVGPTSIPPAFTVLIDPEGNEVCVCTWSGRDELGW